MMTKGVLKETNFRGSSYFEINLAWQYISYCFINVIILLFSISDTVFPVSYKNNYRRVLQ